MGVMHHQNHQNSEISAGPEVSHGENMVAQACNADEEVLLAFKNLGYAAPVLAAEWLQTSS